MRYILVLGGMILSAATFAYLNHYQNELMMGTTASHTAPSPSLEATSAPDVSALAGAWGAVQSLSDLNVSLKDLPYEIEVRTPYGRTTRRASAMIVFKHDEYLKADVPFRTDVPNYVLEQPVNNRPADYLAVNPQHDTAQNIPEPRILSPEEMESSRGRGRAMDQATLRPLSRRSTAPNRS